MIGYFPSQPELDAGIVPDVSVSQSAGDIATGRDPVMEAALRRLG